MPAEQVAAKWDIGFASEDMRLYEVMSLAWHMRFIASIYSGWDAAYAETLLKRFDLRPDKRNSAVTWRVRYCCSCETKGDAGCDS